MFLLPAFEGEKNNIESYSGVSGSILQTRSYRFSLLDMADLRETDLSKLLKILILPLAYPFCRNDVVGKDQRGPEAGFRDLSLDPNCGIQVNVAWLCSCFVGIIRVQALISSIQGQLLGLVVWME